MTHEHVSQRKQEVVQRLRTALAETALHITDIAALSGCNRATVSSFLRGGSGSRLTIARLQRALGILDDHDGDFDSALASTRRQTRQAIAPHEHEPAASLPSYFQAAREAEERERLLSRFAALGMTRSLWAHIRRKDTPLFERFGRSQGVAYEHIRDAHALLDQYENALRALNAAREQAVSA